MIIFGSKASRISEIEIPAIACGYCQNRDTQHVSIFGKYFHIYWIPFFPVGKKAVAECMHCKRTIEEKEFSDELKSAYNVNSSTAKTPFWHWLGLGTLGLLVAYVSLITSGVEQDPRSALLDDDMSEMTSLPSMDSDSNSFKIKRIFDAVVSEEIQPEEFEYFTKVEDDKVLILVKIPKLKKIAKSSRVEILEVIEMTIEDVAPFVNKEVFIGIHGKVNFMIVKTPLEMESKNFVLPSPLYEFYGET